MSTLAPETADKSARRFRLDLKTAGPLIALALLILLGISLNENFLSYNNLTNVLARTSFIGIIAIGATFVITSGGLDLSVGSMAAVIAGVMIIVMNALIPSFGIGWSVVLAGMAAGIAVGGLAGFGNVLEEGQKLPDHVRLIHVLPTRHVGEQGVEDQQVRWLAPHFAHEGI